MHTIPHLCPQFILMLLLASELHPQFLFLFSDQTDLVQVHPQFSFQSFFFKFLVTILAVCVRGLKVQWLLHFVAMISSLRQSL